MLNSDGSINNNHFIDANTFSVAPRQGQGPLERAEREVAEPLAQRSGQTLPQLLNSREFKMAVAEHPVTPANANVLAEVLGKSLPPMPKLSAGPMTDSDRKILDGRMNQARAALGLGPSPQRSAPGQDLLRDLGRLR